MVVPFFISLNSGGQKGLDFLDNMKKQAAPSLKIGPRQPAVFTALSLLHIEHRKFLPFIILLFFLHNKTVCLQNVPFI